MTPVKKPEPADPVWAKWHQDALDALSVVKKAYKPGSSVEVKGELYKRAMPFLLSLFNNKCAYCEAIITDTHPGDVEHYRPKGRLKDMDGKIVKVTINGKEVDHPGYWWLCYEWENLLPSCIDCNRRRNHGEDSAAAGKADIFPINGKRAGSPNDPLTAEDALLLNPTEADFKPEDHFEFQKNGLISTKSKRGELSCELLGLNLRETLVEQRAEAFQNARTAFSSLLGMMQNAPDPTLPMSDDEKALRERINRMWNGRTQHTAFARLALSNFAKSLQARNIPISLPLATS